MMNTYAVATTEPDTRAAVGGVMESLKASGLENPDLLVVYASEGYDHAMIGRELHRVFPGATVHGATSCLGVMTQDGYAAESGAGMGLFAVEDRSGHYGTAVAAYDGRPGDELKRAVRLAIERAGMEGALPEVIWVDGSPGHEEEMLDRIREELGTDVPVVGGSAADNAIAGKWRVFDGGETAVNGAIVTTLYPSVETSYAFHSGYTPTQTTGTVTAADGRTIVSIDNRPAAEVYNEWSGGAIAAQLARAGGNVLADSTMFPLGRETGQIRGVPYFRLSHPESVTGDRGLALFSAFETGDQIVLMRGTADTLVNRAGRVVRSALDYQNWEPDDVAGALVIYCAGCMLAVQDRMDEVVAGINRELPGIPYLGAFTFGEQGCFLHGGNYHGNLMISTLVFGTA